VTARWDTHQKVPDKQRMALEGEPAVSRVRQGRAITAAQPPAVLRGSAGRLAPPPAEAGFSTVCGGETGASVSL